LGAAETIKEEKKDGIKLWERTNLNGYWILIYGGRNRGKGNSLKKREKPIFKKGGHISKARKCANAWGRTQYYFP